MTKGGGASSLVNKKETKLQGSGAGIKAFFSSKKEISASIPSLVQNLSSFHENISPVSEMYSNTASEQGAGEIGHSSVLVTPNIAIDTIATSCVKNCLNQSTDIDMSTIPYISGEAMVENSTNKKAFFPLFVSAPKIQPKNISTKDTSCNRKQSNLSLSDIKEFEDMNDFPTESAKKSKKNSQNRNESNNNKRKKGETQYYHEVPPILIEEHLTTQPISIKDTNGSTHQVDYDNNVTIDEIDTAAEVSIIEEVLKDSNELSNTVADTILAIDILHGGTATATERDPDTTGRRISARLQQRQQLQPQFQPVEDSEDDKQDRKSRKQRRVATARRKSSPSDVISLDSSSSGGGLRKAKKSTAVVLTDGSGLSSESSDSASGRRGKRKGKKSSAAESVEKKNPFFLSKAQKVLLAAQEREQRIQESIARTAAENNKLFAASVDKNRKTAVLFLPQAPSSSAVQGAAVSDVLGEVFDAFQDMSLCAMMSHVGMAAPLSKHHDTLQALRSCNRHPLPQREMVNDRVQAPPPLERDTVAVWSGLGHYDHRRGDDLSSLPLSLQRNYWLAQMNLRFMWTLYCESLIPPGDTIVDLTAAEDSEVMPTSSLQKTSGSDSKPELCEEVAIARWLDYWNMRRKTQRTHSTNARNELCFPGSDDEAEEAVVAPSRRRQTSDTPKKPARKSGRRGRRRKNSYDDDEEDEDEDEYECDDFEEEEGDQEYFSASESLPRSGSARRNIVTDEKAPPTTTTTSADSLSIVMIVQGPMSSGKTSLVHSAASRMGLNVIEINCSQVRNAAAIKKLFSEAAHSHTIAPAAQAVVTCEGITVVDLHPGEVGGSIILFDEVDIIFEEDSSLYSSILQLAKVSKCPIVLTSESSAISSRFKQLSPEIIQLRRRDSNVAARYMTPGDAGSSATGLVALASALADGDSRAVALQMQLSTPAYLKVEAARKSFAQLLIENNIDFAYFDSFLSALSSRSSGATAPVPVPAPCAENPLEETVCLLAPVVRRVEPRAVALFQGQEPRDDAVSISNSQLSRTIHIRGRGFTYSKERIALFMASCPDAPTEATIREDVAVRVEVLADERQCESVRVLSDSLIAAVLPATVISGLCVIVVRVIFSSSWTVSVRSDQLASDSDCNWVTVKFSSFGNIAAPETSSASKRKPPLGSGSRRKSGRKKAKLSRGRPKAPLSTSSDDAGADAEEELHDSQLSEAEEAIVSQLDDSVINIHALVNSDDGESDNLEDIRRGNKQLLRLHSKNSSRIDQDDGEQLQAGAANGVAMSEFASTMHDDIDTEDTETESENDRAVKAVLSPVRPANRRRIVESDSEDDEATELATQPVAENLTMIDTAADNPNLPLPLPVLLQRISDNFTQHMSKVLEIIGDPSLHGINEGIVNIAVDFAARQEEEGPGESSLDLETVKQSLVENLYTAEHSVANETLTLFDPTSFIADMYSVIDKSVIPSAALVLTNVLHGGLLKALEDCAALCADTSSALYRCDVVETIAAAAGEKAVQVTIALKDTVVATFHLRDAQSAEDPTLVLDISDLCKAGKLDLHSLKQLLISSKTFAGVLTFESQRDDVIEPAPSFDELDESSAVSNQHQAVRFLFSRPKPSQSISISSLPVVANHRDSSFEGLCAALDSWSDADVMLSAAQRLRGLGRSAYRHSTIDDAGHVEAPGLVGDDPSSHLDGQRIGDEACVMRRFTTTRLESLRSSWAYESSGTALRQFVRMKSPPHPEKEESEKGKETKNILAGSPFLASEVQAAQFTRSMTGFLSGMVSTCNASPCSTLLPQSTIKGLEASGCTSLPAKIAVDIVPMLQMMCRCEAHADELARQARERQLSEREMEGRDVSPRDYGRGMRIASTRRRNYLLCEGVLAPRDPPPLKPFQYMSTVTGSDHAQLDSICKLSLFST